MSQVSFRTIYNGVNAEVVAGWDSPLRYYHLTIFNIENEDEPIYSCLDTPDPFKENSIENHIKTLSNLGVSVPDGFWERASRKEGNVFYSYNGHWDH